MTKGSNGIKKWLVSLGLLAAVAGGAQSPPADPQPPQATQPDPQLPPSVPQPPPSVPQPPQPAPQPPGPQPETEPVIVEQPQNQQVKVGASATFHVKATGRPTPIYQWSLNGNPITGATSASYTTAAATLANDGDSYEVTVSNKVGNPVFSDPAILNVIAP